MLVSVVSNGGGHAVASCFRYGRRLTVLLTQWEVFLTISEDNVHVWWCKQFCGCGIATGRGIWCGGPAHTSTGCIYIFHCALVSMDVR